MEHYENHVKTKRCPMCGKNRPWNWFAVDGEPCWKCNALSWQRKQTPEDHVSDSMRKRKGGE